jgi:hypothetical protein
MTSRTPLEYELPVHEQRARRILAEVKARRAAGKSTDVASVIASVDAATNVSLGGTKSRDDMQQVARELVQRFPHLLTYDQAWKLSQKTLGNLEEATRIMHEPGATITAAAQAAPDEEDDDDDDDSWDDEDLRAEFGILYTELAAVKLEVGTLRTDLATVRTELASVKAALAKKQ